MKMRKEPDGSSSGQTTLTPGVPGCSLLTAIPEMWLNLKPFLPALAACCCPTAPLQPQDGSRKHFKQAEFHDNRFSESLQE